MCARENSEKQYKMRKKVKIICTCQKKVVTLRRKINMHTMKRILSFLLLLFVLCAAYAEPVRILGIGNSFTVDALEQHFQPLLTAEGVDAIIGYPYRGGTFLSQHDAWSNRTDTLPYNYRKFKDGKFTSTGLATYSLKMAMQDEAWDYVLIQSDHDSAGIYKSYVPYMEHLIEFVKTNCTNPNVKIGFYMTWAYDKGSTYSGFKLYKQDQKAMYDSIINAAQKVMAAHPDIKILIPCGTAVQNARTSYMGEKMNRDGYHLNYNHGRYVAALSWYEALFGKSAIEVTWKPSSITDYCADMCRAAVHAAIGKPYEVTDLSENYSEPEHEAVVPGTESRLKRMTVNGLNVVLKEDKFTYYIKVNSALKTDTLYALPIDLNAELNITDKNGSDIEKNPARPWYYPLPAPSKGDTVTYRIRVISEAMGADETIYKLKLIGAEEKNIVYPIASRADLEDFAKAVNGGSYAINGKVTADFSMDHTKQDCWMTPIGTADHPWTGTFDGRGHTISGFNIYSVDNDLLKWKYVGLFGYIKGATIKNLRIEGTEESYFNYPSSGSATDTKNNAYGILCGCIEAGTIQDCSVSMPIFTNVSGYVGMLVGTNAGTSPSHIERCFSEGTWRIRRNGIYGGIIGYVYNCTISDCYSVCKLGLQRNFNARIGGILGYVNNANGSRSLALKNCHFYGKISDDRASQGQSTSSEVTFGAMAGQFGGSAASATKCWYLTGSAEKAFGIISGNTATATEGTAEQFKNGTVKADLGSAWKQGEKYPELVAPVIPEDTDDQDGPEDTEDPTDPTDPSDPEPEEPTTPEDLEPEEPDEEALEGVQSTENSVQKTVIDGLLYIMYNGTKYNVQGQAIAK